MPSSVGSPLTPPPQRIEETPTARAESGEIQLPQPNTKGSMSLEEALLRRRSVRMYRQGPLSLQDIAQLFWAAQGMTASWGGRTAPSAGALYPLETYAATANGVYHYLPREHRARIMMPEDIR
ncbi:MAG: nitroreductase family protein, partial [Chloroflexi bacterium]|nr:nitroreductase family protein [Chloroflexota bacterium]